MPQILKLLLCSLMLISLQAQGKEPTEPQPASLPQQAQPASPDLDPARCAARLYFEFDHSELRASEFEKLKALLPCIQRTTQAVLIEGHTSEQGTEPYNLMLGERMASSVKRALLKLGIEAPRLKTSSRGESQPLDPKHNEAAWAKNLRVEIRLESVAP